MEFTTEKRREMTSSVIKQNDMVLNSEKFSDNINSAYGAKVDEDKTNREIFITLNSELTGHAYEYKYITGKHHPMLEEEEFEYIDADTETNTFVKKSFWDCRKLHAAANLEEENEFHLNLNESATEFYPIHPEKYSRWVPDDHEEVFTTSPTEQELFNTIRNVLGWYNNGGNSGHSQDLTIYNEFKVYDPNVDMNKQQYMTVGFLEYTTGSPTYMSDGYDPVGDIIYINKHDDENFCLAKIIDAKKQPSRILIAPFFMKGEIPNDAIITSNHDQGNEKYIRIAHELLNKLEEIYKTTNRYLTNNPNKNVISNLDTIENINAVLLLIKNFRNGDTYNVGRILGFVNDIESLRQPLWNNRIEYIKNLLTARKKLYEDRFKIIDMRLSKRAGTLREMMKIKFGITEIFRITDEQKGQVDWFKKYFVVRKCERDGDWKRRVFILDPDNDFKEGDEVYLLSDNPKVPEIKAVVDIIVLARLDDPNLVKYDEKTGETIKEYYPVKKLFFKNAWKDGQEKLIRFFPDEYKTSEGFRIIKQITMFEIESNLEIITLGNGPSTIEFLAQVYGATLTIGNSTNTAILDFIIPDGIIIMSGTIDDIELDFIFNPSGIVSLSGSSNRNITFETIIESEKLIFSGIINDVSLNFSFNSNGIINTTGLFIRNTNYDVIIDDKLIVIAGMASNIKLGFGFNSTGTLVTTGVANTSFTII